MNPATSESPTKACGSLCFSGDLEGGFSWRRACPGCSAAFALYSVSIPSGIIMMRHVPTSNPVPSAEMTREWLWDKPKERGRIPARNELRPKAVSASLEPIVRHLLNHVADNSRYAHRQAEAQQHQKTVPHIGVLGGVTDGNQCTESVALPGSGHFQTL